MAKKTDEINQLEERVASLEDQLRRAVADYHNLEKRVAADSSSVAQYLCVDLVGKLLPVLDSLDQAVAGANQSEAESGWLKGVLMSLKEFRQVLAETGLAEIDTNGPFNPMMHEAVDVRQGENDKILEVTQRGYTLMGKVLRPAKVVVGKESPQPISEEAKKEELVEES